MCVSERKTARRGRCALPETPLRTRAWRRVRAILRGSAGMHVLHYAAPLAPTLPALPALRRMTSPAYFTPFALYGSGTRRLRVVAALHDHAAVLARHLHRGVERARELALRALHLHRAALDREVDVLRERDGEPADAAHLPDLRQDLAAEALAARFAAAHDTRGGRYDRDAEAAEHARDLIAPRVHAPARTADAVDAVQRRELPRVLQADDQRLRARLDSGDVALGLQDLRDVGLEAARRDLDGLVARADRVAQAREHVADGVVHGDATAALRLLRRGLARARVGGRPPTLLGRRRGAFGRALFHLAYSLPAGLRHSRELAHEGALAEADAAQAELADVAARPSADLAAAVRLHLELRRPLRLHDEALLRHSRSLTT